MNAIKDAIDLLKAIQSLEDQIEINLPFTCYTSQLVREVTERSTQKNKGIIINSLRDDLISEYKKVMVVAKEEMARMISDADTFEIHK